MGQFVSEYNLVQLLIQNDLIDEIVLEDRQSKITLIPASNLEIYLDHSWIPNAAVSAWVTATT